MKARFFGFFDADENTIQSTQTAGLQKHKSGLLTVFIDKNASNVSVYRQGAHSCYLFGDIVWCQDVAKERCHAQIFLERYLKDGTACHTDIDSGFLALIYHHDTNECEVLNDRFCRVPLYYSNEFIFGSSLAHISNLTHASISPQAVYSYLYFHMIPSPQTIYENIKKLIPASCLKVTSGSCTVKSYWQPRFTETSSDDIDQLSEHLHDHMSSIVKRNSNKEETGAFLSGGLDSSTVSAYLSKSQAGAKTFSIGFPIERYNELDFARITSTHFNTDQHEYIIQPNDVSAALPDIVASMEEPFGNSSVLPTFYCARFAKGHGVTTLLAGDGGDELFAGNERYGKQFIFEKYFSLPTLFREKLLEPSVFSHRANRLPLVAKARNYIHYAKMGMPDRLSHYNFLLRHANDNIFTSSFAQHINQDLPLQWIRDQYHAPKEASLLNRMLYLDWKHTLADNDIHKVSSMCELAGVNVRYPFLSNQLVDFSCQIPSSMKMKPRQLRYFYKYAMRDFLPEAIINKSKHGFGLPFGVWIATDKTLQKQAYEAVDSLRGKKIFEDDFIDLALDQHQSTHAAYYGELIWVMMVLGLWFEQHNVSQI